MWRLRQMRHHAGGWPTAAETQEPSGKDVDRATCLDVDEHGSVATALALGVLVHADHAGYCGGGVRKRGDQPQQGVPADRNLEGVRHPGAGPARERKTDRHQRRPQPLGPSPEPAGETGYLLGEGHALARSLLADEPPHPQRHHNELARRRQITRESQVGAVHSPRPAPAPRAGRPPCGRTGLDPDDRVDHLDRFHQHALDRGKQQLVQLRQHFAHGEGLSTTPPSSQTIFGRISVSVGGQCAYDWLAAHEAGSTHQAPLESII